MKRIAAKLMEYGMDFEYENYGSQGEKIQSGRLGLEITSQQGILYFQSYGEHEKYPESEDVMNHLVNLVDDACIEETT